MSVECSHVEEVHAAADLGIHKSDGMPLHLCAGDLELELLRSATTVGRVVKFISRPSHPQESYSEVPRHSVDLEGGAEGQGASASAGAEKVRRTMHGNSFREGG